MPTTITRLCHFVDLLVKEIALCGDAGAAPLQVVQSTLSTFSIESLSFASINEHFELLRMCWDPLMALSGDNEVAVAASWQSYSAAGGSKTRSFDEVVSKTDSLLFVSSSLHLHALGARPWINPLVFSNKFVLILRCIADAREKGAISTFMATKLGMSSNDMHHHLDVLKSYALVTSRKCQVVEDGTPKCTNWWHLSSLPAASAPPLTHNFAVTYGDIRVECPSVSDEDLNCCMEILQNSGGTLSLDDFVHNVSHHPLLKDKGSSRSKATGYQQLVEELVQHRHVRRVMALVKTSVRFKIPALQVYDSNDAQLPPSMYPFRLLPKVPLSNQVQTFIHQCGSYGCTSADIIERLRVPKKTLERILAQLNDDDVSTSRQCYGNNKTIVYISKITQDQEPSVFKVSRRSDASDAEQKPHLDIDCSFARPAPVVRQNVPWEHLDLNDMQLMRLDLMHSFLQQHPVTSVYAVSNHVLEQERLSGVRFRMSSKTFDLVLDMLLPFVASSHILRMVEMKDKSNLRLLMPPDMQDDDAAVTNAYNHHCDLLRQERSKRLGLDMHLGVRPQPQQRQKRCKAENEAQPVVRKKRKVKNEESADEVEDNDAGDAPDLAENGSLANPRSFSASEDSDSGSQASSFNHQYLYQRLMVIPSVFMKAYVLHSFIISRRLQTTCAEDVLSSLPFRLLVQILGIPEMKDSVLFSLFQELRILPAVAMDCNCVKREAVLKLHRKKNSGFARAWNLLLKLSVIKLQQDAPLALKGAASMSQEVDVSQSMVIQNVDAETFGKISNFGCVYYEPNLCVFSLRNSAELRQMWMFFKQLSFDIESDDFPDRSVGPSLPDAHCLPDILRFGGVFRCDLKAVSAKKRPSSWALPQFSGIVVTKLTNFLKNTTDLQDALENCISPHKWLTSVVPQILAYDFYYGGLEIFVEYRKLSNSQQVQLPSFLDGQDDDDASEAIRGQCWNLDSESKLLSIVLLHYSDKMRHGRIPSGHDLEVFCKRVNWKLVSRFVREPAVACRNHFTELAPCSQCAIALQTFRDKFPEMTAGRELTSQMAQELAQDIRVKVLVFSDSFFLQNNVQGQNRDFNITAKIPSKASMPWHKSFNDCLAAGLVIKRIFCADHYDPSVAASAKHIDDLLSPDQVVAGSHCLASFGATLLSRSDKNLRWTENIPKFVTDKLKVDKNTQNRLSLQQKSENFQNGVEKLPSTIPNVHSSLDAAALAVLHLQGQLSFECKWHIESQPAAYSKKVSIADYLQNRGLFRPVKRSESALEAAEEILDLQQSEFNESSRFMYHLNGPDVKLTKHRRNSIADLECEPSCWKSDFPAEAVERASAHVHAQLTSGVDMRLVCDAVGIDVDDAAAFRRHLLSGLVCWCHFFVFPSDFPLITFPCSGPLSCVCR
jgi:hypothetical protein